TRDVRPEDVARYLGTRPLPWSGAVRRGAVPPASASAGGGERGDDPVRADGCRRARDPWLSGALSGDQDQARHPPDPRADGAAPPPHAADRPAVPAARRVARPRAPR